MAPPPQSPPGGRLAALLRDAEERGLVELLTEEAQRDPAVIGWAKANSYDNFSLVLPRRLIEMATARVERDGAPLMAKFVEDPALQARVTRAVMRAAYDAIRATPAPTAALAKPEVDIGGGLRLVFDERGEGEETPRWAGRIFWNGENVGSFENDGRGGATIIQPERAVRAFQAAVDAAAPEVPPGALFERENLVVVYAEAKLYDPESAGLTLRDVVLEYAKASRTSAAAPGTAPFRMVAPEEGIARQVLGEIAGTPRTVEEIEVRVGWDAESIQAALKRLALADKARIVPGAIDSPFRWTALAELGPPVPEAEEKEIVAYVTGVGDASIEQIVLKVGGMMGEANKARRKLAREWVHTLVAIGHLTAHTTANGLKLYRVAQETPVAEAVFVHVPVHEESGKLYVDTEFWRYMGRHYKQSAPWPGYSFHFSGAFGQIEGEESPIRWTGMLGKGYEIHAAPGYPSNERAGVLAAFRASLDVDRFLEAARLGKDPLIRLGKLDLPPVRKAPPPTPTTPGAPPSSRRPPPGSLTALAQQRTASEREAAAARAPSALSQMLGVAQAAAEERRAIVAYLERQAVAAEREGAKIAAYRLRTIAGEAAKMTLPATELRAAVIKQLETHALLITAEELRQVKHLAGAGRVETPLEAHGPQSRLLPAESPTPARSVRRSERAPREAGGSRARADAFTAESDAFLRALHEKLILQTGVPWTLPKTDVFHKSHAGETSLEATFYYFPENADANFVAFHSNAPGESKPYGITFSIDVRQTRVFYLEERGSSFGEVADRLDAARFPVVGADARKAEARVRLGEALVAVRAKHFPESTREESARAEQAFDAAREAGVSEDEVSSIVGAAMRAEVPTGGTAESVPVGNLRVARLVTTTPEGYRFVVQRENGSPVLTFETGAAAERFAGVAQSATLKGLLARQHPSDWRSFLFGAVRALKRPVDAHTKRAQDEALDRVVAAIVDEFGEDAALQAQESAAPLAPNKVPTEELQGEAGKSRIAILTYLSRVGEATLRMVHDDVGGTATEDRRRVGDELVKLAKEKVVDTRYDPRSGVNFYSIASRVAGSTPMATAEPAVPSSGHGAGPTSVLSQRLAAAQAAASSTPTAEPGPSRAPKHPKWAAIREALRDPGPEALAHKARLLDETDKQSQETARWQMAHAAMLHHRAALAAAGLTIGEPLAQVMTRWIAEGTPQPATLARWLAVAPTPRGAEATEARPSPPPRAPKPPAFRTVKAMLLNGLKDRGWTVKPHLGTPWAEKQGLGRLWFHAQAVHWGGGKDPGAAHSISSNMREDFPTVDALLRTVERWARPAAPATPAPGEVRLKIALARYLDSVGEFAGDARAHVVLQQIADEARGQKSGVGLDHVMTTADRLRTRAAGEGRGTASILERAAWGIEHGERGPTTRERWAQTRSVAEADMSPNYRDIAEALRRAGEDPAFAWRLELLGYTPEDITEWSTLPGGVAQRLASLELRADEPGPATAPAAPAAGFRMPSPRPPEPSPPSAPAATGFRMPSPRPPEPSPPSAPAPTSSPLSQLLATAEAAASSSPRPPEGKDDDDAARAKIVAYLDERRGGAPLRVITREVAGVTASGEESRRVVGLLRQMREEGILDMRVEDDERWYTLRSAVPSPMLEALTRLLGDEARAREVEAAIEGAAQDHWWDNIIKTRVVYGAAIRHLRGDEALADKVLDIARQFESQVLVERPAEFVSRTAELRPSVRPRSACCRASRWATASSTTAP